MLERKNRWLTIVAIATIIILLIAVTGGPVVIRAASIQLVDEDNNTRAESSSEDDVVGPYNRDESGIDRLLRTHIAEDNVNARTVASATDQ